MDVQAMSLLMNRPDLQYGAPTADVGVQPVVMPTAEASMGASSLAGRISIGMLMALILAAGSLYMWTRDFQA